MSRVSFEYRHRRVVGVEHPGAKHRLDQTGVQRPQQLGRVAHPVAERRPRQLHALTLEDAFQAIERQVIRVLAGDDVRQQPRPRQTLVDRLRRFIGDGDVLLAVLAGVLGALMDDDEQRGWLVVELFAGLDTDRLARLLAGRT